MTNKEIEELLRELIQDRHNVLGNYEEIRSVALAALAIAFLRECEDD